MFKFGIKADHFVASALYLRKNSLVTELTKLLKLAQKFPVVSDDAKYHLANCNSFVGRREIALELLADFNLENSPPKYSHLWLDIKLDMHQFDQIYAFFDAAIARGNDDPQIHYRYAITLYAQGRHDECQQVLDKIDRTPDIYQALDRVQSRVHFYNGRKNQAVEISIAYLEDPKSDITFFYQHYFILLCMGHIEQAMSLLRRRARPSHPKTLQTKPSVFEMGSLVGKTIYISPEQGIGDRVEFARYYDKATQMGIHLKTRHPAKLARLFKSMTSTAEQIARKVKADEVDSFISMACLPALLNTKSKADMQSAPYLQAEPNYVNRWRERLPTDKPLIGLAWKGSDRGWFDHNRSIPLKAFLPLLQRDDVNVVCLQIGAALDEINDLLPEHRPIVFDDLDVGNDAYVDTAGLIANLDLVVSSDTSMAHVAGAMGARSMVLLGKYPDFRWLIDESPDFLYENQHTIRQTTFGDWDTSVSKLNKFIDATVKL